MSPTDMRSSSNLTTNTDILFDAPKITNILTIHHILQLPFVEQSFLLILTISFLIIYRRLVTPETLGSTRGAVLTGCGLAVTFQYRFRPVLDFIDTECMTEKAGDVPFLTSSCLKEHESNKT